MTAKPRRRKVVVLFDTDEPPPPDGDYGDLLKKAPHEGWYYVYWALEALGHDARLVGVYDDVAAVLDALRRDPPDVIYQLVEQFGWNTRDEIHLLGLLQLLGIPYTGSPPRSLHLCGDKAISKKILSFHGVPVPEFTIFDRKITKPPPSRLRYPLIVKPLLQDASLGITRASVVKNDASLRRRVARVIDEFEEPAIAEEMIFGRELYVSVMGNRKLEVFPPVELKFRRDMPPEQRVATWSTKWDNRYRKRHKVRNELAGRLDPALRGRVEEVARTTFRALELRGYARVDCRVTPDGEVYVIEVNPNPFLAEWEDFHHSADAAGWDYYDLIQHILDLALDGD